MNQAQSEPADRIFQFFSAHTFNTLASCLEVILEVFSLDIVGGVLSSAVGLAVQYISLQSKLVSNV